MDRRTFNKSVAGIFGSLLLPSRMLGGTPTLIELQQFCDEKHLRWDFSQPFGQGEWTYATDARICVRTKLVKPPDKASELNLPDANGLGWIHSEPQRWRAWPRKSWISAGYDMCPMCDWTGRVGAGVVACGCDFGCDRCGDTEYVGGERCDYCEGKGFGDFPSIQPVGRLHVRGIYDRKIRSLGDVEYVFVNPSHPESPIAFRFDGGQGIVMPLMRSSRA